MRSKNIIKKIFSLVLCVSLLYPVIMGANICQNGSCQASINDKSDVFSQGIFAKDKDPNGSQSLSFSNKDLGLQLPISIGAVYSKIGNYTITADMAKGFNAFNAFALNLELGRGQQRFSGTLSHAFTDRQRIKFTTEYLTQNLDEDFNSGKISQWVGQMAYGLEYQYIIPTGVVNAFNLNVHYSNANSKDLPTIFNVDTGYANARRIAGGVDRAASLGVDLLPTKTSLVNLTLNYDSVHYDAKYDASGKYDGAGMGATASLEQLLGDRLKLKLKAQRIQIYTDYSAELDFLFPTKGGNRLELGLMGSHVLGTNETQPNDTIYGFNVSYSLAASPIAKADNVYHVGARKASGDDLVAWTASPAVRMATVLAVKDESVLNLRQLSPSEGPCSGGNIVTITGSGFGAGNAISAISFGGYAGRSVVSASDSHVQVVAPAYPNTTGRIPVDVTLTKTNGASVTLHSAYTYTNEGGVTCSFVELNSANNSNALGNTYHNEFGFDNGGEHLGIVCTKPSAANDSIVYNNIVFGSSNATDIQPIGNAVSFRTPNMADAHGSSGVPLSVKVYLNGESAPVTMSDVFTYYSITTEPMSAANANNGDKSIKVIAVNNNNHDPVFGDDDDVTLNGGKQLLGKDVDKNGQYITFIPTVDRAVNGSTSMDLGVQDNQYRDSSTTNVDVGDLPPDISAIDNAYALTSGGAKQGVKIHVTNFTPGQYAHVVIGGNEIASSDYTVDGDGNIVINKVPAHAAGSVSVDVSDLGGPSTKENAFTYYDIGFEPSKTLTGEFEAKAKTSTGELISIPGLFNTPTVTVPDGTGSATDVAVVESGGVVTFKFLENANLSTASIKIANNNGSGDSATGILTYQGRPKVDTISPVSGAVGEKLTGVTIGGSNFLPGATVKLQNATKEIAATNLQITDTQIIGDFDLSTVTKDDVGSKWNVVVVNQDTQIGTKSSAFEITAPKLVSIAITPVNPNIALGNTLQFVAKGMYTDGPHEDDIAGSLKWTSNGPSVTMDPSVPGKAKGAVIDATGVDVTATDSATGKAVSTHVKVTAAALILIKVTPKTPTIAKGLTDRFTAMGTYTDGDHDITDKVNWASGTPDKATIDSNGVATGVGVGEATIIATDAATAKTGSGQVEVTAAELTAIAITPVNPSIVLGNTLQFVAKGTYTDGQHEDDIAGSLKWTSSGPSVTMDPSVAGKAKGASVDAAGVDVTATDSTGKITASTHVKVTAAELTSIAITPVNPNIALGNTLQFVAKGTYTDGQHEDDIAGSLKWTSSGASVTMDPSIAGKAKGASVDAAGVDVTATDSTGKITASTHVKVTAAELKSIAITPVNPSIALGNTLQFVAKGTYTDGQHEDDIAGSLKWTSSGASVTMDPSIAGKAKGAVLDAAGVDVTATDSTGKITASTHVKVTAAELKSIAITPVNPSIALGNTLQFVAKGTYTDGQHEDDIAGSLKWTSSGASVTMDPSIAGKAKGAVLDATGVDVTATDSTGKITASTHVKVTAAELTSIAITPVNPSIALGDTLQFSAKGTYTDGQHEDDIAGSLKWTSSGASVTMDPSIAGKAKGAVLDATGVDVTATDSTGKIAASTHVKVTAAVLSLINVTSEKPSIAKGATDQFTAIGIYTDGVPHEITATVKWESKDPTKVTIADPDHIGLATGVAIGETDITAKDSATGKAGSGHIIVTAATISSVIQDGHTPTVLLGGGKLVTPVIITGTDLKPIAAKTEVYLGQDAEHKSKIADCVVSDTVTAGDCVVNTAGTQITVNKVLSGANDTKFIVLVDSALANDSSGASNKLSYTDVNFSAQLKGLGRTKYTSAAMVGGMAVVDDKGTKVPEGITLTAANADFKFSGPVAVYFCSGSKTAHSTGNSASRSISVNTPTDYGYGDVDHIIAYNGGDTNGTACSPGANSSEYVNYDLTVKQADKTKRFGFYRGYIRCPASQLNFDNPKSSFPSVIGMTGATYSSSNYWSQGSGLRTLTAVSILNSDEHIPKGGLFCEYGYDAKISPQIATQRMSDVEPGVDALTASKNDMTWTDGILVLPGSSVDVKSIDDTMGWIAYTKIPGVN